ncbi:MAG: hypothetical protein JKX76_02925 [Colwellia sp.]|nr:hypothetical protein [Colwellia sp.]
MSKLELKGGIFFTVKDLMILTGKSHYQSASREHLAIRDGIAAKKRKLTVREYCDHESLKYDEIMEYLNKYR